MPRAWMELDCYCKLVSNFAAEELWRWELELNKYDLKHEFVCNVNHLHGTPCSHIKCISVMRMHHFIFSRWGRWNTHAFRLGTTHIYTSPAASICGEPPRVDGRQNELVHAATTPVQIAAVDHESRAPGSPTGCRPRPPPRLNPPSHPRSKEASSPTNGHERLHVATTQ